MIYGDGVRDGEEDEEEGIKHEWKNVDPFEGDHVALSRTHTPSRHLTRHPPHARVLPS